ncbi:hypothetical protein HPO96_05010 [Kribbella sandramycini]|uniref:Uncharacterized protein n=1 Tax=Kribbella sandramycini TaxID=60450 RepID=A0A7Y4KVQ4_9ACTN|nr:hypothetical protein [Kribbella sandramycini]MBB6567804.1 hypothetical protein [Kribbella sandramycini]NOL39600.1 hypothetical protein [Kribbella sandramycini]
MNNLPELMHRATDGLEPESADLVERSVLQGLRLRRRRTALASAAGVAAVAATVAVVAGAVHVVGQPNGAQPAGALASSPTPSTPSSPTPPAPFVSTTEEPGDGAQPPVQLNDPTLKTLRTLLKGKGKLTAADTWGSAAEGYLGASYVVDDGKGGSQVQVMLSNGGHPTCKDVPGCSVRADGSTIRAQQPAPEYPKGRNVDGVLTSFVEITRKGGRFISVTSYNAVEEKGSKATRPLPILTVAQLTKLADDTAWKFPAPPKGQGTPKR